ncbi:MAG: SDR family oxidoreductase [Bacteroidota bacterium]
MHTHFFITGGTGLVGSNMLPRLLRAYPGSTMTLLVRGEDEQQAGERIRTIAQRIAAKEGIHDAVQRIDAMLGDVALDQCGLTQAQIDRIANETTHVIHGAATIRFDHPLNEARDINCGGTRRLLAIARSCRNLERFVYVGSSSVSGQRAGEIYESELEMGQTFFNTYEQSKNESERIVRDHMHEIPSVVFRPSIIIGDSRTGKTSTFNVIYIPLRLLYKGMLTYVPGTPETTLDLVPIDWVDDAMVAIMQQPESISKVFHITAGPQRAARLGEVVLKALEYFDQHAPLRKPRTMEFISREEFERRRAAMGGREEALMSQLDTLLPYVSIDRLFDSANTDALLARSGVGFPLFKNYSEKIFAYCIKSNWGKQ